MGRRIRTIALAALVATGVAVGSIAVSGTERRLDAAGPAAGVVLAVYEGGTVEGLVDGAGTAVTSIWVSSDGTLTGYVPLAPAFVNAPFLALFPGGVLPAMTAVLIVHPAGVTPPPSTISAGDAGDGRDPCANAIGNGLEIVSGPDGPTGEDFDSVFRSLTVHPTDPDTVILGTERNGVVISHDGGSSWTRHRQGIRHAGGYPEFWDIAVSPHDPSLVIAATLDSPGPVQGDWPSSGAGVYRSVDGGESWARSNCGLTSSRITSVSFDPIDPAVVVIGIEGGMPSFMPLPPSGYAAGGLFRSVDRGLNWTQVSEGSSADTNGFWRMESRAGAGAAATVYTFGMDYSTLTNNLGFLRSDDGGTTWTAFAGEHRTRLITSFDVSSDGRTIYAHERDRYSYWRSGDGGATWTERTVPNANGPIAVSPSDANLVLYSGRTTLSRSTNGLLSAVRVLDTDVRTDGSSQAVIHDIEFAPSNPNIVYVATDGYLVYRSDDAGMTFQLMANVRAEVLNASN